MTAPTAGDRIGRVAVGRAELVELGLVVAREVLREAPVDDDGLAEIADEDVRRREVAVQHVARVRERDRLGRRDHRGHQREPVGERRRRGDLRRERHALDEPHHVERRAIRPPTDLVDRHDPGVLELRGDPRLALEPRDQAGRRAHELLDRDGAADAQVARRDDAPHAAARDLAAEQVARGVADAHGVRAAPTRGRDRDLVARLARGDVVVDQRERGRVGVALIARRDQQLDELAVRLPRRHGRCHATS